MPEARRLASGVVYATLFLVAPAIQLVAQVPQATNDYSITITIMSEAGTPLAYSTVAIAEKGIERFSNQRGEFYMSGMAPGVYRLRVRQLGFTAKDTVVQLSPPHRNISFQVRLTPIPFVLENVVVTGVGQCPQATDLSDPQNAALGLIFGEVSKNADRVRLLQDRYPYTYTLWREFTTFDSYIGPRSTVRDTVTYSSASSWKYLPGEVVQHDSITAAGQQVMRLPQLVDLADTTFQQTHCFYYRGTERRDAGLQHRIDFIPLSQFDFPDVEGSVFIDTKSYVLTSAVFRLTGGERLKPPITGIEVTTEYSEIYPSVVIFREIRATQPPTDARRTRFNGLRQRQHLVNHRFLRGKPGDTVTYAVADSITKVIAKRDSISATFGAVAGTVHDPKGSLLSGVIVSTEDPSLTAVTDVRGQFVLRALLGGEQDITVSANGYETARIQVDVAAGRTITLSIVMYPKPGT